MDRKAKPGGASAEGAVCHARGCMVGCMGKISHTNLKNRMVISGVATSKNHMELLVPDKI